MAALIVVQVRPHFRDPTRQIIAAVLWSPVSMTAGGAFSLMEIRDGDKPARLVDRDRATRYADGYVVRGAKVARKGRDPARPRRITLDEDHPYRSVIRTARVS
jgi:hypothetical protein